MGDWSRRSRAAMPAPSVPLAAYEVVRLADGVHGFVWKNPFADPIQGNALFIINDRDVVVVDTGLLPSTARVMAAELRKLTAKPVRYVINTHWHDDHHTGNGVYRELWPEVEFIGHRDTRAESDREVLRRAPAGPRRPAGRDRALRAVGGHRQRR